MLTDGTGNISVEGKSGSSSGNFAVRLEGGGSIVSSSSLAGAGTITITADNVVASGDGQGLRFNGGLISTDAGNIDINASALVGHGMSMFGGTISSSGDGQIDITTDTTATSGAKVGLYMDPGTISTSGNGSITVNASTADLAGVLMNNFANIESTGSASATITVNATSSSRRGIGMQENSFVRSSVAAINLNGVGSSSIGNGIVISENAIVESTGTATVDITGTGGAEGVLLLDAGIRARTVDGDLTIDGTSSIGDGVAIRNSAEIDATTGNGAITIIGESTLVGGGEHGIHLESGIINSSNGDITLTGTSSSDLGISTIGSTIDSVAAGINAAEHRHHR